KSRTVFLIKHLVIGQLILQGPIRGTNSRTFLRTRGDLSLLTGMELLKRKRKLRPRPKLQYVVYLLMPIRRKGSVFIPETHQGKGCYSPRLINGYEYTKL